MSVIVDQNGTIVTNEQIQGEFADKFAELLSDNLEEFEKALSDRCKEEDVPFFDMGFQPNAGSKCYQVDMNVYAIRALPTGLVPMHVGVLQ